MNQESSRTDIAVLGMGAMGSRMAGRLRSAGHNVRAWTRSRTLPEPLKDLGVINCTSAAEAVSGVAIVIAMLRDDSASQAVWLGEDGVLKSVGPESLIIECSTLSPRWIERLAEEARTRSLACVEAPVLGSRPQAEAGQLLALLGGDEKNAERAKAVIAPFAPRAFYLGQAGLAAAAKLVINGLYAGQVAMLAECTAFLKASGVRDSTWLELLGTAPTIAPPIAAAGRVMSSGTHAPMFPIELVRKDLAYLVEAMQAKHVSATLPLAVGKRFSEAESMGLGDKNITAVSLLDKAQIPNA